MSAETRPDLDARAAAHYGCDVPVLAVGDTLRLPDGPPDVYVVQGFRGGGMLVEAVRTTDGREFSLPRHYVPLRGDAVFLTPNEAA